MFLTIVGSYGVMDEVKLTGGDLDGAGGVYPAGSALSFSMKSPEIGSLSSAIVRVVSNGWVRDKLLCWSGIHVAF